MALVKTLDKKLNYLKALASSYRGGLPVYHRPLRNNDLIEPGYIYFFDTLGAPSFYFKPPKNYLGKKLILVQSSTYTGQAIISGREGVFLSGYQAYSIGGYYLANYVFHAVSPTLYVEEG